MQTIPRHEQNAELQMEHEDKEKGKDIYWLVGYDGLRALEIVDMRSPRLTGLETKSSCGPLVVSIAP